MTISFSQLAKLGKMAAGGLNEDMLAELAESFGMEFSFADLQPGQVPLSIEALRQDAERPGADVMRLTVRLKDGRRLSGLVVNPDAGRESSPKFPS